MKKHLLHFIVAASAISGWTLGAADAPPPAAVAPAVDPRDAEIAQLRGQVAQLAAAVRKLQEQRDAAYAQLLNQEVQKAINEATPAAAAPAAQPTALNPQGK